MVWVVRGTFNTVASAVKEAFVHVYINCRFSNVSPQQPETCVQLCLNLLLPCNKNITSNTASSRFRAVIPKIITKRWLLQDAFFAARLWIKCTFPFHLTLSQTSHNHQEGLLYLIGLILWKRTTQVPGGLYSFAVGKLHWTQWAHLKRCLRTNVILILMIKSIIRFTRQIYKSIK